jgi:hypothetical protein
MLIEAPKTDLKAQAAGPQPNASYRSVSNRPLPLVAGDFQLTRAEPEHVHWLASYHF